MPPALTPPHLRSITCPRVCPLIPELRVPALPDRETLDDFRSSHAALLGAGVPYWAVPWPGGQALARFLLDRPDWVAGRPVADFGCGNGLVAAAAMRAGAASAIAIDQDPNALIAAAETARLNDVEVETAQDDFASFSPLPGMLICAADLWYEPHTARRATAALAKLAAAGAPVLFADPGRPGRPRTGTAELAAYRVPVRQEFERADEVETKVFMLADSGILAGQLDPTC